MGIYRYIAETKGKKVVDRNLAAKLSRFLKPPTSQEFKEILICGHPLCGAGITIALCDANGDIFPCGCAVCDKESILGNINTFHDTCYIERVENFHSRHNRLYAKCDQCLALTICRCGCAAFGPHDPMTAESECYANRHFFDFLKEEDRTRLIEMETNIREVGLYV